MVSPEQKMFQHLETVATYIHTLAIILPSIIMVLVVWVVD